MSAADLLAPGERCLAAGKGLRAKPKPGVVEMVLGKRYIVLLDGETEAQPFGLKKVKRLGKPPAKKVSAVSNIQQRIDEEGVESVLEAHRAVFGSTAPDTALRDQRPPTRLHIPDANVPAVEPGTPTVLRNGQPDRPVIKLQADSFAAFGVWVMSQQPKPRKPSRSAAYLQHVREHDCCNCGAPGPSDPDHVGSRGVGQKCSDYETAPLCRDCHRTRTDRNTLPNPQTSKQSGRLMLRERAETEIVLLRAQVQCLREWAEKIEKETP